jgi:hypothetical protein
MLAQPSLPSRPNGVTAHKNVASFYSCHAESYFNIRATVTLFVGVMLQLGHAASLFKLLKWPQI